MFIKFDEKNKNENEEMTKTVEQDTELKSVIVDFVGNKIQPEDGNITTEMIVDVFAKEFPEFLMVVAEENFVRGYEQGLSDMDIQEDCAAADSLGLCLFGRSVTNVQQGFIAEALNNAHGTDLTEGFMKELGREALAMEWQFNKDAGFTEEDDELPQFFYDEILSGKNVAARHHTTEVNAAFRNIRKI